MSLEFIFVYMFVCLSRFLYSPDLKRRRLAWAAGAKLFFCPRALGGQEARVKFRPHAPAALLGRWRTRFDIVKAFLFVSSVKLHNVPLTGLALTCWQPPYPCQQVQRQVKP